MDNPGKLARTGGSVQPLEKRIKKGVVVARKMDPVGVCGNIFLVKLERVSLLPDHLVTFLDSKQDRVDIDG